MKSGLPPNERAQLAAAPMACNTTLTTSFLYNLFVRTIIYTPKQNIQCDIEYFFDLTMRKMNKIWQKSSKFKTKFNTCSKIPSIPRTNNRYVNERKSGSEKRKIERVPRVQRKNKNRVHTSPKHTNFEPTTKYKTHKERTTHPTEHTPYGPYNLPHMVLGTKRT